MYSFLALIHVAEGKLDAVLAALRDAGAAAAPTMEGSFNGGDAIALFDFADEAAFDSARGDLDAVLKGEDVERADTAFFRHGRSDTSARDLETRVYRALLLCADRPATPEKQARFDAEIVLMPKYIPAIANWRYSEVLESSGERAWTHLWEQEYADVGGLMGPYMMHPYHWARIDRWFDPECPEWLVDTRLCHSFGTFDGPVITEKG